MASLLEPTGEVVDEMIREGETESADASHKEFSDRKLLESRAKKNMAELEEFSFE